MKFSKAVLFCAIAPALPIQGRLMAASNHTTQVVSTEAVVGGVVEVSPTEMEPPEDEGKFHLYI